MSEKVPEVIEIIVKLEPVENSIQDVIVPEFIEVKQEPVENSIQEETNLPGPIHQTNSDTFSGCSNTSDECLAKYIKREITVEIDFSNSFIKQEPEENNDLKPSEENIPVEFIKEESDPELPKRVKKKSVKSKSSKAKHELVDKPQSKKKLGYSCKSCFTHFASEGNLLMHIYRNQGVPFKCKKKRTKPDVFFCCEHCDNKYSYKQHLIRHMKNHFVCKYCSKSFVTPAQLKAHFKDHMEYKCNFCAESFEHNTPLDAHVRIVHGENPYKCDQCEQSFAKKGNLQEHMTKHSDVRPFACTICGKAYKTRPKLKKHMFKHDNGYFPCDICPSTFKNILSLKGHKVKVHSGKKYQCAECKKWYSNRSSLATHMMTHSDEGNKYPCSLCQKVFKYPQTLKVHIGTHTSEKPHTCRICFKNFSLKSYLGAHVRKVHKGNQTEYFRNVSPES